MSKLSTLKEKYKQSQKEYEIELDKETKQISKEIKSVLSEDAKQIKKLMKFKQKFSVNVRIDVDCDFAYYIYSESFGGFVNAEINNPKGQDITSFLIEPDISYHSTEDDESLKVVYKLSPEIKAQALKLKKVRDRFNIKIEKLMKKYNLDENDIYNLLGINFD